MLSHLHKHHRKQMSEIAILSIEILFGISELPYYYSRFSSILFLYHSEFRKSRALDFFGHKAKRIILYLSLSLSLSSFIFLDKLSKKSKLIQFSSRKKNLIFFFQSLIPFPFFGAMNLWCAIIKTIKKSGEITLKKFKNYEFNSGFSVGPGLGAKKIRSEIFANLNLNL